MLFDEPWKLVDGQPKMHFKSLVRLLGAILITVGSATAKEPHCTWEGINAAIVSQADAALQLTASQQQAALAVHLPWGRATALWPVGAWPASDLAAW